MKRLISTLILTLASFNLSAGVDTGTDINDVILAGHDTVAYHLKGRPVEGDPAITAVYEGAIYRFANTRHRDLFVADPAKYAPAYGGYCALGTSFGKKFDVDGKAFEVVNGRLYVNKNREIYQTWRKEIPANIEKAEQHWPKIRDVDASKL